MTDVASLSVRLICPEKHRVRDVARRALAPIAMISFSWTYHALAGRQPRRLAGPLAARHDRLVIPFFYLSAMTAAGYGVESGRYGSSQ